MARVANNWLAFLAPTKIRLDTRAGAPARVGKFDSVR